MTWPTLPSSFPAAAGSSAFPAAAESSAEQNLAVIIEQFHGSGQAMRWTADEVFRLQDTRATGRAAALQVARNFRPNHPTVPGQRTIYRLDPDTLLVIVFGALQNYHFRVQLVEFVEDLVPDRSSDR